MNKFEAEYYWDLQPHVIVKELISPYHLQYFF